MRLVLRARKTKATADGAPTLLRLLNCGPRMRVVATERSIASHVKLYPFHREMGG